MKQLTTKTRPSLKTSVFITRAGQQAFFLILLLLKAATSVTCSIFLSKLKMQTTKATANQSLCTIGLSHTLFMTYTTSMLVCDCQFFISKEASWCLVPVLWRVWYICWLAVKQIHFSSSCLWTQIKLETRWLPCTLSLIVQPNLWARALNCQHFKDGTSTRLCKAIHFS